MAELIVKIGDSPSPLSFRDEDIVHAHNDVYLLWQATQRITDHRKLPGGFFKRTDTMAFKCQEAVRQYKFERINRTSIKRITLADMSEETLSATPNANGEAIDVLQYIARRKAGGKLAMFGNEASVIWFGGRTDASLTKLSTLWTNTITPETGLLEADHTKKLPDYRPHFLKRWLVVVTDDFSNMRGSTIEEPDLDVTDPENPITLALRKHKVVWRSLSGLSAQDITDIADPNTRVDVDRGTVRSQSLIVEAK